METQDRSALAIQDKTTRGRGRESDFEGRGCGGGRSGGRGEEVIYYYCKEPGHTRYNCPLLQVKQQQQFRSADVATGQKE